MSSLEDALAHVGGDVHGPLQELPVAMYVLDRKGRIVWVNDAAEALVPGATGKLYTDVLAPEYVPSARRVFARRILGRAPFADHTTVIDAGGPRVEVDISSVPLRNGHQIVGVFGVVRAERPVTEPDAAAGSPALTPRQHEVLRFLGAGMTTNQMAEHMGLSPETVRNHVKAALGELNAKSRLEAVLTAYRTGLLPPPGGRDD